MLQKRKDADVHNRMLIPEKDMGSRKQAGYNGVLIGRVEEWHAEQGSVKTSSEEPHQALPLSL